VAVDPQPLDAATLIRRKRRPEDAAAPDTAAEVAATIGERQTAPAHFDPVPPPAEQQPAMVASRAGEGASAPPASPTEGIRMKPRETVSLAVVHARVPEQIARGLKLMSVMEGRQAQNIVAEALEGVLNIWNPRWREIV